MMRLVVAVVAGALATTTPALAAEWWWPSSASGEAPNRSVYFVDLSSVRLISGGVRQVWVQTINETPEYGTTKSMMELMQYDCASDRSRTMARANYYANGNVVSSESGLRPSNWSAVIPESVDETLLKFTCGHRADGLKLALTPKEWASYYFTR